MGNSPYIVMKITGLFNRLAGSLFTASRPPVIGVVRLDPRANLPVRATALAAGWDVTASCLEEPVVLEPGDRFLFKLGFALELPANMEAQVRPRSGWALKHGITVLNSPGTIDADYKGECGVILVNHGRERFVVHPGDRIAQLVFSPVPPVVIQQFDNQTVSNRGKGGFGSTGR